MIPIYGIIILAMIIVMIYVHTDISIAVLLRYCIILLPGYDQCVDSSLHSLVKNSLSLSCNKITRVP